MKRLLLVFSLIILLLAVAFVIAPPPPPPGIPGGAPSLCSPTNGGVEICDGLDNDCDDFIDENIIRNTTCGLGVCSENTGTQTCVDGDWTANTCNPFEGSSTELCDEPHEDENCNGEVDEGCDCEPGTTQTCGPDSQVGTCVFGNQTCSADRRWGPCVGGTTPEEIDNSCDGLDNDCDGQIDEDFTTNQAASLQQGVCVGAKKVCVKGVVSDPDFYSHSSLYTLNEMGKTWCDGFDNDCDGLVDENNLCSSSPQTSVSCTDGLLNNGETDTDCGGPCPPCGQSPNNLGNDNQNNQGGEIDVITPIGGENVNVNKDTGLMDDEEPSRWGWYLLGFLVIGLAVGAYFLDDYHRKKMHEHEKTVRKVNTQLASGKPVRSEDRYPQPQTLSPRVVQTRQPALSGRYKQGHDFVTQLRAKGFKDDQIREKLKSTGWSDTDLRKIF